MNKDNKRADPDFNSFGSKPAKLEGYLSYLQSIERNIDRRAAMNKMNLSVLIPALTAYALLKSAPSLVDITDLAFAANLLLVLSALISLIWIFQILRFREVSRIKFEVASKLESDLGLHITTLEEEIEARSRSFISYTHLELFIPICALIGSCYVLLFS